VLSDLLPSGISESTFGIPQTFPTPLVESTRDLSSSSLPTTSSSRKHSGIFRELEQAPHVQSEHQLPVFPHDGFAAWLLERSGHTSSTPYETYSMISILQPPEPAGAHPTQSRHLGNTVLPIPTPLSQVQKKEGRISLINSYPLSVVSTQSTPTGSAQPPNLAPSRTSSPLLGSKSAFSALVTVLTLLTIAGALVVGFFIIKWRRQHLERSKLNARSCGPATSPTQPRFRGPLDDEVSPVRSWPTSPRLSYPFYGSGSNSSVLSETQSRPAPLSSHFTWLGFGRHWLGSTRHVAGSFSPAPSTCTSDEDIMAEPPQRPWAQVQQLPSQFGSPNTSRISLGRIRVSYDSEGGDLRVSAAILLGSVLMRCQVTNP
jgi:hypothetical protein